MTGGEPALSALAALLAEPARAKMLLALTDGRALAASVLADEAGVSAPTASAHLAKLRDGGLIRVERSGRHRYHRLASPQVATALEGLAALAPAEPIRSLRQHTRAAALRGARSCYDHLAGRLGVAVTSALLDRGALVATDGVQDTGRRPGDPLSAQLPTHPYRLGEHAAEVVGLLGVDKDVLSDNGARRPLLRFCLDWSEQRHHLSGRLGAAVLTAMLDQDWLARTRRRRALELTEVGARELRDRLDLDL
ncbi:ArsR/SmtB family transcription factor [Pseudonocardia acaciae]|uniref:ArsR/SmtB family transcription factor n=1 Tax=Pseudonocardia acaciae TaxID=551276 RepID=UPI00048EE1FA|nr:helix-turn-helix domain-containing protein [Pseudonocardia acaciae]